MPVIDAKCSDTWSLATMWILWINGYGIEPQDLLEIFLFCFY